jgi:RNA polymerase sigma-70 factor (ECF subfamily)
MAETIPLMVDEEIIAEDDASLVQAARQSLAGFKPLYQKWLMPVYRYFYYRVGNEKDAEDLTAQIFLKIYEELPRYRERGHFPAWLFALVRNKAADYFRRGHPDVHFETVRLADESTDLLAHAIRSDEIQSLARLIGALQVDEQELIRLRFIAELSYAEIGVLLGMKEDATRKSISRLLARLKVQLEVRHA